MQQMWRKARATLVSTGSEPVYLQLKKKPEFSFSGCLVKIFFREKSKK